MKRIFILAFLLAWLTAQFAAAAAVDTLAVRSASMEAIIGAAALTAIQQYNFTKAFMGANGVALDSGFTTPDPEEAAVKAAVIRRARETWFLVDDTKFARPE